MAEVLVVKPGAVKPADRKALREAGVVVVEVENPTDVVFMRAGETLSSSDMLWAALDALRLGKYDESKAMRSRLTDNLFHLICEATDRGPGKEAPRG